MLRNTVVAGGEVALVVIHPGIGLGLIKGDSASIETCQRVRRCIQLVVPCQGILRSIRIVVD